MAMLAPPQPEGEQRVVNNINQHTRDSEQRVIDESPNITIPLIMNAPGIMELHNPTKKRVLKTTPCPHCQDTRNNTPGVISTPIAPAMYTPILSKSHQWIVTQHAMNALMCNKRKRLNLAFTPTLLYYHPWLSMLHCTTGETISSYKKLRNESATSKVWHAALGKDFGGMACSKGPCLIQC
jgi:hypothetical protein